MWLTLRENYLLHEATASEKVTYEDFSQIASLCTEKMAERNGGLYQSCICDSSRRGPYINWFSLASAQRICDTFLDLDKDGNSTLDQEELQGYSNGTLTIFLLREVRMEKLGDRIASFQQIWEPLGYHDCKMPRGQKEEQKQRCK
ncbi:unnamed protein product [Lactuca virosa]|uniref:EF-hand domain-containing protein n=1 Tax=Lactuca virosa TaxID=75947 RepID=A0AAU9N5Z1_9ASTR|nr:unnamed protein product [Lactuca virosa]